MQATKTDILTANTPYLRSWVPVSLALTEAALTAEAGRRIAVSPNEADQGFVRVSFQTAILWVIRDGSPDVDEAVKWLKSLVVPGAAAAASVATAGGIALVINGVATSLDAATGGTNLVGSITEATSAHNAATFEVPINVVNSEEAFSVQCKINGFSCTSDTGPEEHACIPDAELDVNGDSVTSSHYNVGLDGQARVRLRMQLPEKVYSQGMVSSRVDIASILETNGRAFGATMSAVYIDSVELSFTRKPAPPPMPPPPPPHGDPPPAHEDGSAHSAPETSGHHGPSVVDDDHH